MEGSRMTARYFYLSYAHSPPLAGSRIDASTPDEWVREFFQDLSRAVNRRGSTERGLAASSLPARSKTRSRAFSGSRRVDTSLSVSSTVFRLRFVCVTSVSP